MSDQDLPAWPKNYPFNWSPNHSTRPKNDGNGGNDDDVHDSSDNHDLTFVGIMEEIVGCILVNLECIEWKSLTLLVLLGFDMERVLMMTTWPLLVEERALEAERGPGFYPGCAGSLLTHSLAHCTVLQCTAAAPVQCREAQSTWRYGRASTCSSSPRPGCLRLGPVLLLPRGLRPPALPPRAVLRQVLQMRQRWALVPSKWKGSRFLKCLVIQNRGFLNYMKLPCVHEKVVYIISW